MNNHKESKAVRAVMENYMKGTYEADEALLKSVFHEKAIMNGFLGSQTVLADPSAFIADMMSAPSMKSQGDAYQAEIEQIRIDTLLLLRCRRPASVARESWLTISISSNLTESGK